MSIDLLYKPNRTDCFCALLGFSEKSNEFFKISSLVADLAVSLMPLNVGLKIAATDLKLCSKFFSVVSFASSASKIFNNLSRNKTKGFAKNVVSSTYHLIETISLGSSVFKLNKNNLFLPQLNVLKKVIILAGSFASCPALFSKSIRSQDVKIERDLLETIDVLNVDLAVNQWQILRKRIAQSDLIAVTSILALGVFSALGLVFTSFSSPVVAFAIGSVYLSSNFAKNYYKYNFKKQEMLFKENAIKIIDPSIAK